jgi:uncharacterized protein YjgD (DUF1641 family)
MPPAGGGLLGLVRIASNPDTHSALRFMSKVAGQMRARQKGQG